MPCPRWHVRYRLETSFKSAHLTLDALLFTLHPITSCSECCGDLPGPCFRTKALVSSVVRSTDRWWAGSEHPGNLPQAESCLPQVGPSLKDQQKLLPRHWSTTSPFAFFYFPHFYCSPKHSQINFLHINLIISEYVSQETRTTVPPYLALHVSWNIHRLHFNSMHNELTNDCHRPCEFRENKDNQAVWRELEWWNFSQVNGDKDSSTFSIELSTLHFSEMSPVVIRSRKMSKKGTTYLYITNDSWSVLWHLFVPVSRNGKLSQGYVTHELVLFISFMKTDVSGD